MQSLLSQIKQYYPSEHIRMETYSLTPQTIRFLQSHINDGNTYTHGQSFDEYIRSCNIHKTWTLDHVTIHMVCPTHAVLPNKLVQRVIRRVVCIARIYNIQKTLTFWFMPTRLLREFPQNPSHMIDTHHINGGFTYTSQGLVFIFRKEEFPKVMLHETLHHSPVDTYSRWKPHDLMTLYQYFNIDQQGCPTHCKTELTPNEAIVETWAELYQIAFLAHEYGFSHERMLNIEKDWACKQAKRVLEHQRNNFPLWREKSHAFSYVVIRAALLHNIRRLIVSPTNLTRLCIESFESDAFQKAIQTATIPKNGCFRMCIFSDL